MAGDLARALRRRMRLVALEPAHRGATDCCVRALPFRPRARVHQRAAPRAPVDCRGPASFCLDRQRMGCHPSSCRTTHGTMPTHANGCNPFWDQLRQSATTFPTTHRRPPRGPSRHGPRGGSRTASAWATTPWIGSSTIALSPLCRCPARAGSSRSGGVMNGFMPPDRTRYRCARRP